MLALFNSNVKGVEEEENRGRSNRWRRKLRNTSRVTLSGPVFFFFLLLFLANSQSGLVILISKWRRPRVGEIAAMTK
jgi:hypothetical protein